MIVTKRFSFDDNDRRDIALYFHQTTGDRIPRGGLATREQLRQFIDLAMSARNEELSEFISAVPYESE